MKLPCARHLANHILVQELALLATLSSTDADSSLSGSLSSDILYEAARRISRSSWAVEEMLSYGPQRLRVDPIAQVLLLRRIDTMAQEAAKDVNAETRVTGDQRVPTPLRAPAYDVALYGPHAPLPNLPNYLHDDVSYDEACHHAALLRKLLEPYGFVVQLSGATRRGAPVGRLAEFSLSLTQTAIREIEALQVAGPEAVKDPPIDTKPLSNGYEQRVKHDSFAFPSAILQRIAGAHGDGDDSLLLDPVAKELLRQLPFQWCSRSEAVSHTDFVPYAVKFRYTRALEGLFRSGYIAAGRIPKGDQWHEKRQSTKIFTLRYDPHNPMGPPPFHIRDSAVRARMKLHQAKLDFMPWHALHVRRFFRTGPAAFTAYVALRALQRGLELNLNGIFLCCASRDKKLDNNRNDPNASDATAHSSSTFSMDRKRLLVQSEKDIFQLVGLPYTDPFARGIFCQKNNITLSDGG
ncbi:unnamed protein product [Phytomonas sp. EM1]|nr:unnamed protein product [Phytomonas sp. EM1]|eukprot:CCW64198.1 unnamed protein product [Phytomonas sp. isolate EM1]